MTSDRSAPGDDVGTKAALGTEAGGAPPCRVLIYGSCVCRDTVEFLEPSRVVLVDYVARQSVISAMGLQAPQPAAAALLPSPFQRRMMLLDAASSLPHVLRSVAGGLDSLVLDLVDERLGVFEYADGSFATDSVERRSLGPSARAGTYVPFGSPRHRALFAPAVRRLRGVLDETGLTGRVVLLAPAWAREDRGGGFPDPSYGLSAEEANPIVDEYVDVAADVLDCPIIGRDVEVRAEREHRWGSAPFHYDDTTYDALAAALMTAMGLTDTRPRPTTLRRAGAPPLVTISWEAPAVVEATVRSREALAAAFELHRGPQRLATAPLSRSLRHRFDVRGLGPGPYRVRAFVKDAQGSRSVAVSDRLRVDPKLAGAAEPQHPVTAGETGLQ